MDGWENCVLWLTVSSLMHRAETGARCPLSWVTNDNLLRSQMMQVRSREPLTTMRYADDAVRHVTASVWPSSACDARKQTKKTIPIFQKKNIWLTRDVKVKNGVVLDFKVEHKAECEQLLSLLISLVKILNADCFFFFGSGVFTCLSISDLALSLEVPVSHTQMAVLVPPVITSFGFGHMAQTIWPHSDRHSYTTSAWRSELD